MEKNQRKMENFKKEKNLRKKGLKRNGKKDLNGKRDEGRNNNVTLKSPTLSFLYVDR